MMIVLGSGESGGVYIFLYLFPILKDEKESA